MDGAESKRATLRERWHKTTISNQIMVIATVFIAIATAISCNVGVAALQWHEMAGASKDTRALIAASDRQAAAAESGVRAALASSAATNRLTEFMNAGVVQVGELSYGDAPTAFQVVNTGKVAAKNVQVEIIWQLVDIKKGSVLRVKNRDYNFSTIQATYTESHNFPVEYISMTDLLANGQTFMQAVKGRYNDGFGTIVSFKSCRVFVIKGPAATATGSNAECGAVEDMPGYGRVAGDLLQKVDQRIVRSRPDVYDGLAKLHLS
jgi:hypothetical protein